MSLKPDIQTQRLSTTVINDNFVDIAPSLTDKEVLVASERCLFCYDAPCIKACPTGIDIPLFIRKINTGNGHGAAKEILSANILGGSCARVCPTETLCEQACVRTSQEQQPVAIGRLQRYAVEQLDPAMGYPFERAADTGKQVAIVGAGPAGLACAHRLARLGHKITIFEAAAKSGGLNEYGIAEYKLVDDYAQQEVDFILAIGGIEIRHQHVLGDNVSLKQLQQQYDAVFLAMGLGGSRDLGIDGESLSGVEDAVEYISRLRQSEDLGQLPVGRRIVVIGGGMTAIDIAVQSKKLGAGEVTITYRRDVSRMGASFHEQALARAHGVCILCQAQPLRIEGQSAGASTEGNRSDLSREAVTGVVFAKTEIDDKGRPVATDETFTLECDVVFKAIGQGLDPHLATDNVLAVSGNTPLKPDARGKIAVDEHFQTSVAGLYAGGDCIHGQDLVVEAVDHGNKAALSIHRRLTGGDTTGTK